MLATAFGCFVAEGMMGCIKDNNEADPALTSAAPQEGVLTINHRRLVQAALQKTKLPVPQSHTAAGQICKSHSSTGLI